MTKILETLAGKIINQLSALGSFPFHRGQHGFFAVSLTTRCNFHCPHCLRGEIDKHKTLIKDLPVFAFETALKEAKKIGFQYVSLTGGEPILHPRFKELVSLINKYGYKFNFVTNGWLYKEYWEIIEEHRKNLRLIFLSLDGVTAEVHDAVRNKPGSFKKLMETIKFYKSHNVPLTAIFCVTKKNFHQIELLPDFCLGLGINVIKWATVIPIHDESGAVITNHCLTDKERAEALERILNLQEKYKFQCNFQMTYSFYTAGGKEGNLCPVLDGRTFYIDHDGAMFSCCDLNRECKSKPLIQELGFEKSLKITLDSANEIKKKLFGELLNNPQKIVGLCDFCNQNIESSLDLAVRHRGCG